MGANEGKFESEGQTICGRCAAKPLYKGAKRIKEPTPPPSSETTIRAKNLNNAQKQALFGLLHRELSDQMLPTTEWEATSARNARGKRNPVARLKEMGLTDGEFGTLTDQGRALAQELAAEHYAVTGTNPPAPRIPHTPPPTPPPTPTPPTTPPPPFKEAVVKGQGLGNVCVRRGTRGGAGGD